MTNLVEVLGKEVHFMNKFSIMLYLKYFFIWNVRV